MENKETNTNSNKKLKIIIAILLAIIIVLILLFTFKGCDSVKNILGDKKIDIEVNQSSKTQKDGMSKSIAIPGYPEIPLKAGSKEMRVALENPKGNDCLFSYELILKSTGESLYKSGYIKPGNVNDKQTLKRGLKKGTYEATLKVRTVSLDSKHVPKNGANVATKLIVN